jgi:hypothetical protein
MRNLLPIAALVVAGACAARQPASDAASPAEAERAAAPGAAARAVSPPRSASSAAEASDEPRGPSLPEVRVEAVGLHIGGGSNDEAARTPFKQAIAAEDDEFLRCYRLVEDPMRGGTFGVDLFIPRDGGNAEVRQPRTGMRGEAFRRCMLAAFAKVEFERPALGPTVISYSLRFVIHDSQK